MSGKGKYAFGLSAGFKVLCGLKHQADAGKGFVKLFHGNRIVSLGWVIDDGLAALEAGARFINASSAATYGDGELGFSDDIELMPKLLPLNMYGYSKKLFDMWCLRHNLLNEVVNLKFFNVYGPNEYHKGGMMSMVCRAVPQVKELGKIRLFKSDNPNYGDGESLRDFVYSKDVSALMYWFMETPSVNGIYNVGAGKARTWNDLAKAVFAAMDLETNIEYWDAYLAAITSPSDLILASAPAAE